jgi:hypothetical protein
MLEQARHAASAPDRWPDHDRTARVRTNVKFFRALLIAISLVGMVPAYATRDDLRSVRAMRDNFRVLIVFTPSLADARLAAQRAIMARLALDAAKRDLLFVQVDPTTVIGAHDKGDKLRRRFRVPVLAYHAILLGKDGRVLREAAGLMEGAAILHAIDGSPLRRAEVRRAHAGKPIVDKS